MAASASGSNQNPDTDIKPLDTQLRSVGSGYRQPPLFGVDTQTQALRLSG